jgi:hypothetical protein
MAWTGARGVVAEDDAGWTERIATEAKRLHESGRSVSRTRLQEQLARTNTTLELAPVRGEVLDGPAAHAAARRGVVIVGALYKCQKCPRWHCTDASGFAIAPGVYVTARHVFESTNYATMVVMDARGRMGAVEEVLASDADADVAVFRAGLRDVEPVPLRADLPAGARVRVMSHPDGHFFSFTEGMVSRYFAKPDGADGARPLWMAVTAEFGKGSSGAPVLDEQGNAVAVVSATDSLYYSDQNGEQKNLQMVFRHCSAASNVLRLLGGGEAVRR